MANDALEFGDTLRIFEVYLHINLRDRRNARLRGMTAADEPDRRVDNGHQQNTDGEHRRNDCLAKRASAARD